MENAKIAGELLKAQAMRTPEGRMLEAALLRKIARSKGSLRSKDHTPPLDRLMSKVMFGSSTCWYWVGHIDALGYGRFLTVNENKAHRVSYRLFHGEIPDGMKVLHKCDVRTCVNPDHLFLGTQAENVHDMLAKGRQRTGDVRGERNGMARLTEAIAAEIRAKAASGRMQKDLATEYGVSPMTVSRLVRGKSWKKTSTND